MFLLKLKLYWFSICRFHCAFFLLSVIQLIFRNSQFRSMKRWEKFGLNSIRWMTRGITYTDYFGVPVSLSYKGESTYKTFIGGLITISIGKLVSYHCSIIYVKKILYSFSKLYDKYFAYSEILWNILINIRIEFYSFCFLHTSIFFICGLVKLRKSIIHIININMNLNKLAFLSFYYFTFNWDFQSNKTLINHCKIKNMLIFYLKNIH